MMPTLTSAPSARQASHLAASTSRRCSVVSASHRRRAVAVAVRASSAPSPSPPPPQPQAPRPPPPTRRPGPGPPRPGAAPLPPGTIMGPEGTPLEVVKVEDTSPDAWAAVAAVDRGDGDDDGSSASFAIAAGDLAALLAFAAVGRASHGEPLDLSSVLTTAAPFIAAWFPVALALGGFKRSIGGAGPAALSALKVWAAAVPLGIVFRSLVRGYAPPGVFVGVTMGVTLFVMVGWRAAFGAVVGGGGGEDGARPKTPQQQLAARKDRRGGPLELLQVIMSLTKRW